MNTRHPQGRPAHAWATRTAALLTALLLSACGGGKAEEEVASARAALAKTSEASSSSQCPYGGQQLQTGLDLNGNGTLDSNEVSSVQYICNGSPGQQALLDLQTEAAGSHCSQGGTRISSGLDANGNKVLDSSEVTATAYVCNGKDGSSSSNSGSSTAQALLAVDEEPAGANCAAGGTRLSTGLDRNGNGVLDAAEVSSTRHICNGSSSTQSQLLTLSDEPAGSYCANGGKRIDMGRDLNGNQLLDASEVSSSARICNGSNGSDGASGSSGSNGSNGSNGQTSLLTMSAEAAGANCANGGRKLSSGLDANSNGTLEAGEVSATSYVCNGASGLNSLTRISNEAAGANCSSGGKKIESGLDSNSNGSLEAGEVSASAYVCNGATGATGASGRNSLVEVIAEAAGANCATGGKRINSGVDSNGNGTLDSGEIAASSYVCNGASGQNSLLSITDETAGANCAAGGKKISSGLDTNANGTLESGEVSASAYVCNGSGGADLSYQTVSASSTAMASNKGYIVTTADTADLLLPASPTVGDRVAVTGAGGGGWRITQNSGQHIDATALGAQGFNWGYTSSATTVEALASSANGMRLVAHESSAAAVLISDDAGLSWTTRSSPDLMRLSSSADGTRLFGSVYNGKLYTSTDRGLSWTARESDREWFTVASSADGQVLLAGGPGIQLYVSTDGGASWTARESARQWYSSAVSADGSVMLAGDFGGQLYVSTDSGASWSARGPSKSWRGMAMSSDGRTLLAGPMGDYLYLSSDGGQTWEARGTSRSWNRVSVSGDGKKLFATVDNGSPSWSLNSGWSWSTPSGAGSTVWKNGVLSTDGKRLLAGSDSALVVVADGRSSLGSSGSLSGEAGSAVMLQYVGNGRWLALSGSGAMTAK